MRFAVESDRWMRASDDSVQLSTVAYSQAWNFSRFWVMGDPHLACPLYDLKRIIAMIPLGSRKILAEMTNEQLRAARGLLGWSQSELASRAGLSLPTVKRLEAGFGPRVSEEARGKLQRAIEAAGIKFIDENGGGLGLRFIKPRRRK
jgi:DNA-binding XRE family transcriptional regulator